MRAAGECCAAVQTCSRCLQSPSGWRPVQRELLQTFSTSLLLVLSSDTAPTTAHHCPPGFFTTCVPKSSRPWKLAPLWMEDLTMTSSCFREREGAAAPCFVWLGREWDSALPCWPVLFSLHPNKDTSRSNAITSQSENVGDAAAAVTTTALLFATTTYILHQTLVLYTLHARLCC